MNDDRGHAVGDEDVSGFGDEGFAEEAGVTADQNGMGAGLAGHVFGDAGDGAADVVEGEFLSDDGAPAGGSKLDFGGHWLLP